jgi:hypothetical protein
MHHHYIDVGKRQHSDDAQRTDRDYIPIRTQELFLFPNRQEKLWRPSSPILSPFIRDKVIIA